MEVALAPLDTWALPGGPWPLLLPMGQRLLLVAPGRARLWPRTPLCGPRLPRALARCAQVAPGPRGGLLGWTREGQVLLWRPGEEVTGGGAHPHFIVTFGLSPI